ncbi:MAG: hypothetical protein LQ349_009857, partial [Xanthoria aureola]
AQRGQSGKIVEFQDWDTRVLGTGATSNLKTMQEIQADTDMPPWEINTTRRTRNIINPHYNPDSSPSQPKSNATQDLRCLVNPDYNEPEAKRPCSRLDAATLQEEELATKLR